MHFKILLKKSLLTILGTIIFHFGVAQNNFLPGYIIALDGDSLHGFVDYHHWEKNPDLILFKKERLDDGINYTPLDIKAFGVLGEIYQGAIVETEVSPTNMGELSTDAALRLEMDTSFLQTLIAGEKGLYYMNKNGKEQFYINQDSSYKLLIHKQYLQDQHRKTVVVDFKRYLGQLRIYLNECQGIQSKLNSTTYTKRDLEKLFTFYYDCTPSEITFQKKTAKLKTEIGIVTGLSLTNLNFNGDNFSYLTDADYHQSVDFSTGLFLNLILPKHQGKWSLYNELMVSSYEVDGNVLENQRENGYEETSTTIGYSYLKMNNMLRFRYPIGIVHLYSNVGISNGFALKEINYRKKTTKLFTMENVVEGKALKDTRKYEQGYILGLGVVLKKYTLEIRFEKGNGMSDYNSLSSSVNRFNFLLGYKL